MEQTMDLRGRLGFIEDEVKLAIMAFQQGDAALVLSALLSARTAIDDVSKQIRPAAA